MARLRRRTEGLVTTDLHAEGYVLVTPVRDEVRTVKKTIESILGQTVAPAEWVIVSDGSTDGTNELVSGYVERYPWIRLVETPPRRERSFAAVVQNTERGIRALRSRSYAYLGLLDADVVFQPRYFEQLIRRFAENPRLGLGGGLVIDVGTRKRLPRNRIDVPGAVQFYRRECFESLGGLCAIPEGGWDPLACAMARMKGYETRLFVDLEVDHLKPRNSSQGGVVRRNWQMGMRDYASGYHPVFELIKCLSRVPEPPLLSTSLVWWLGYCAAAARRRPRLVPPPLVAHIRREQMARLWRALSVRSLVRSASVSD